MKQPGIQQKAGFCLEAFEKKIFFYYVRQLFFQILFCHNTCAILNLQNIVLDSYLVTSINYKIPIFINIQVFFKFSTAMLDPPFLDLNIGYYLKNNFLRFCPPY